MANDAAGAADHAAAVLLDGWCPKFAPMRLHGRKRAGFVRPHQAGIADHIGGDDCRQSALNAVSHGVSLAEGLRDRNSGFARAVQRAPMSVVGYEPNSQPTAMSRPVLDEERRLLVNFPR